jgi:hypothetical protein
MHEMNAMHPAAMKVVAFPASSVLAALVCDTCGLCCDFNPSFGNRQ